MMANVPEFVAVWFGILRAGAIEVPVHSAYRGPLLRAHPRASRARAILFCDDEFVDRLDGLDLPALERVVVRGAGGDRHLRRLDEALADRAARPAASRDPGPDDVSCMLYTSGTTGPAKGVVLTHSANLALANANVELMEYTADDVLYTAFPLFHVNAKFTSVVSSMLVGARLVLDDRFSASRFWDSMREHGVTSFNYMGSLLTILAKQPPRDDDRDHPVVPRVRRRVPARAVAAVRGALRRAAARALRHDRDRDRDAQHANGPAAGLDRPRDAELRGAHRRRARPRRVGRARSARSRSGRGDRA